MKIIKGDKAQIPVGFIIGLCFFSYALFYIIFNRYIPYEFKVCRFKEITHIPCPTCGGTRSAFFLLKGMVGRSFLENPLLFLTGIFLSAFSLISIYSYIKNFKYKIIFNEKETKILKILLIGLFFLNWAYLIFKELISKKIKPL